MQENSVNPTLLSSSDAAPSATIPSNGGGSHKELAAEIPPVLYDHQVKSRASVAPVHTNRSNEEEQLSDHLDLNEPAQPMTPPSAGVDEEVMEEIPRSSLFTAADARRMMAETSQARLEQQCEEHLSRCLAQVRYDANTLKPYSCYKLDSLRAPARSAPPPQVAERHKSNNGMPDINSSQNNERAFQPYSSASPAPQQKEILERVVEVLTFGLDFRVVVHHSSPGLFVFPMQGGGDGLGGGGGGAAAAAGSHKELVAEHTLLQIFWDSERVSAAERNELEQIVKQSSASSSSSQGGGGENATPRPDGPLSSSSSSSRYTAWHAALDSRVKVDEWVEASLDFLSEWFRKEIKDAVTKEARFALLRVPFASLPTIHSAMTTALFQNVKSRLFHELIRRIRSWDFTVTNIRPFNDEFFVYWNEGDGHASPPSSSPTTMETLLSSAFGRPAQHDDDGRAPSVPSMRNTQPFSDEEENSNDEDQDQDNDNPNRFYPRTSLSSSKSPVRARSPEPGRLPRRRPSHASLPHRRPVRILRPPPPPLQPAASFGSLDAHNDDAYLSGERFLQHEAHQMLAAYARSFPLLCYSAQRPPQYRVTRTSVQAAQRLRDQIIEYMVLGMHCSIGK